MLRDDPHYFCFMKDFVHHKRYFEGYLSEVHSEPC